MTCFIQNHGAAERSVDSCERNALNGIDEHFVPSKNSLGVGTSFSIHFDAKDDVTVREVLCPRGRNHFGISQGRDSVLENSTPDDLIKANGGFVIVVKVMFKFVIDELVKP